MTRLIDADALSKLVGEPIEVFLKRLDLKLPPTVDAIPIEYIRNQIDRWERSKFQSYHAICYRHLIEEWQMENERKAE